MKTSELKTIFEFVRRNEGCTARQLGKAIPGGKSRANHFLYGYIDILFTKRGLTPPHWSVVSDDAYERLIARLVVSDDEPTPPPSSNLAQNQEKSFLQNPRITLRRIERELPSISVCQSCDLPIQITGRCGCS